MCVCVFILVFVKVDGSVEIYSVGDFGIHRVWLEEKLLGEEFCIGLQGSIFFF